MINNIRQLYSVICYRIARYSQYISNHSIPTSKGLNGSCIHDLIESEKIRNIGIIAHIDAGKTTTTERMLYCSGLTSRIGNVDDGDTVMDYMKQERQRGITITSATISFPWNSHRINLIDTPGHVDFGMEVERSMRVLDGAVLILDASSGVEAQTETVWEQSKKYSTPKVLFMNKMDKEQALDTGWKETLNQIRSNLNCNTAFPIQYPISQGVLLDLITLDLLVWENTNSNHIASPVNIISQNSKLNNIDDNMIKWLPFRQSLIEYLSLNDEHVFNHYLEHDCNPLTNTKEFVLAMKESIRRLVKDQDAFIPVLFGASFKNWGIEPLLDSIVEFLPNPLEKRNSLFTSDDSSIGLAFKVIVDKEKGPMVFVRMYQGSFTTKCTLWNVTRSLKERVSKVLHMSSNESIEISQVNEGNIAVLMGLRQTRTGDTLILSSKKDKHTRTSLVGIDPLPPVFHCSIEPETADDEQYMMSSLNNLMLEDPSIHIKEDPETGQVLIGGMGELHLEIIKDRLLNDMKAKCRMGKVTIAYKETLNVDELQSQLLLDKSIHGKHYHINMGVKLCNKRKLLSYDNGLIPLDQMQNDIFIHFPQSNDIQYPKGFIDDLEVNLKERMHSSLCSGPYIGQSLHNLRVDIYIFDIFPDTTVAAACFCIGELFRKISQNTNSAILEPTMSIRMKIFGKYLGDVIGDLNSTSRRGQVISIEKEDSMNRDIHQIVAYMPLSSTIGYSSHIRSITSGTVSSLSMKLVGYTQISIDEYNTLQ